MQRKLAIIDGNSLMHRAFHALPLMLKDEKHTGAVFGFWSMMLKAMELYAFDSVSVAFDLHGPTFRHEAYAEYKAGRSATPPELREQFDYLRDTLNASGIPIFELQGYEADDMLGTFARVATENGDAAYIITGDRDALQLVDEFTHVILTRKGISDILECTPGVVKDTFGYLPSQVTDYKGLTGDASDNIPGVPGVGDKTALKLLSEYGTLEATLNAADGMKGALRERLITYREQAEFSKRLATIDTHAPIGIDINACAYPDLLAAKDALNALNTFALNDRLRKLSRTPETRVAESRMIDSVDEWRAAILAMPVPIAVRLTDAEITVESANGAICAALGGDLLSPGLAVQPLAQAVLNHSAVIGYDLKTLLNAAEYLGAARLSHDTMIADHLLNHSSDGGLIAVMQAQREELRNSNMLPLFDEVEMPLIDVLYAMERAGFYVDKVALTTLKTQYAGQLARIEGEIRASVGGDININSPKQLGQLLFEKLGLPSGKKTASGWATDVETLESIAHLHTVVPLILAYRKYAKLLSTYIDALIKLRDAEGRVHTRFDQIAASTGRISSLKPNLQNIPVRSELGREIRRAFAAQPGKMLLDADYSQIELRVLAHMSGDAAMIRAFNEGQDIHVSTAAEIFGVDIGDVTKDMRGQAKAVNFGVVYGISDFGLAKNAGVSRTEAADFIRRYFTRFPGVRQYLDRQIEAAKGTGYVATMMGRRRYIPELSGAHSTRMFGERVAMNSPIQGTSADIIKLAMVRVHSELFKSKLSARLILQVHDELIIETPPDELIAAREILVRCMMNAIKLDVPLEVSVSSGANWYECKMGEG